MEIVRREGKRLASAQPTGKICVEIIVDLKILTINKLSAMR